MSNVRPAPLWLTPKVVEATIDNWSEMDFVSVLAEAHILYCGLKSLETDPVLGCHFARVDHGENAADHARMAGDVVNDRADRRQHALQAIAYLGRLVDLLDAEAVS
jgi:hypothetical protein